MTGLSDLAATSEAVGATTKRLAKRAALVQLLTRLESTEVAVTVAWLSGELTQRQIGVGWAALRSLPLPADTATLTIGQVETTFGHLGDLAGPGSRERRDAALAALFAAATPTEQTFLRRLLGGELRQGALAGVMTDAVAAAAGLPVADVRRAAMLAGDLPAVAAAARTGGGAALAAFGLVVGRPLSPMLAQPAVDVADALSRLDAAVFEWKLDGARIQVHRSGDDVAIFTRTLDDVTARLPEIVAAVRALPTRAVVLDGEAIALRPDGSPHPFQVTASRFGRRTLRDGQPLTPFFFDVLHLDGGDLLDSPLHERSAVLDAIGAPRPRRLVTRDLDQAQAFYVDTVTRRHEGVVAKALSSSYAAGRRGGAWLKVKPVHTLDLVVLAVEWGSGRRQGWLSNLHLGARGPDGFVMLGKTFKGLTDELLRWQTERFLALAVEPTDGFVVRVRPEQVVEIAFDGVQRSTRYPGGLALRFARVLRYRDDKRAAEADTLAAVRAFGDLPPPAVS